MNFAAVPIGSNPPFDVNVIIEVPIGGEPIKYELDKASGALIVDRFLYTSMRYPGNYGFIPHTLSGDGDPVDVIIANSRAIAPGAVMSVRPVGKKKPELARAERTREMDSLTEASGRPTTVACGADSSRAAIGSLSISTSQGCASMPWSK